MCVSFQTYLFLLFIPTKSSVNVFWVEFCVSLIVFLFFLFRPFASFFLYCLSFFFLSFWMALCVYAFHGFFRLTVNQLFTYTWRLLFVSFFSSLSKDTFLSILAIAAFNTRLNWPDHWCIWLTRMSTIHFSLIHLSTQTNRIVHQILNCSYFKSQTNLNMTSGIYFSLYAHRSKPLFPFCVGNHSHLIQNSKQNKKLFEHSSTFKSLFNEIKNSPSFNKSQRFAHHHFFIEVFNPFRCT